MAKHHMDIKKKSRDTRFLSFRHKKIKIEETYRRELRKETLHCGTRAVSDTGEKQLWHYFVLCCEQKSTYRFLEAKKEEWFYMFKK